ncbi:MAG TPA: zinc dependent phospholipase C family protein [Bacteroidales bacterium]|nr:zinc dependent phospholipase C family protein [Bacteroidales bacterium]
MKRLKKNIAVLLTLVLVVCSTQKSFSFGFFAHKKINRMAVFALPPEMIKFFKSHIDYIVEHAIDPDKRSRGVVGEDIKHYIDIELFRDSTLENIPKFWKVAVEKYTEDSLNSWGINPWWTSNMVYSLTLAFKEENLDNILYAASNLGHYIADACTPLHTTHYYDGKSLDQKGIHAFWETRIPELYADDFNYLVGREYVDKPYLFIWQLVKESHACIDTVFEVETYLRGNYTVDRIFVYDEKGTVVKKQYSKEYCDEFNRRTNDMVRRRIQRAVHAVASLWYTAWVNAGQPDLSRLDNKEISKERKQADEETEKMWQTGKPIGRPNPE